MYVTFYKDCKIQPNHYIDKIESYLSNLANQVKQITTSKAFISDQDSFSVRVELDETFIKQQALGNWNYCKISTVDEEEKAIEKEQYRYYFVTSIRNISQFIYEFDLELDAVNSYQSEVLSNDTNNFHQVNIKRRHKNRWKYANGKYFRIYDKVDEGLGQVTSEVEGRTPLRPGNETYVITKQLEDSDSLHVPHSMIVNSVAYETAGTADCTYYNVDDISIGAQPDVNQALLILADSSSTLIEGWLAFDGAYGAECLFNAALLIKDDTYTKSRMYLGFMQNEKFVPETLKETTFGVNYTIRIASVKSTGAFKVYYKSNRNSKHPSITLGNEYSVDSLMDDHVTVVSDLTSSTKSIPSINTINRTDSTIKQITALPFKPDTFHMLNDVGAIIPEGIASVHSTFNVYDNYLDNIDTTQVVVRDEKYESKLYGSYVRDHQIVYDTFSLACQPEYWSSNTTLIGYNIYKPVDMTNDIAIEVGIKQQEYRSNVLACNRNNTVPVWTNAWLDYVHNGYNYDNKSQSLTNIKNGLNIASNVVGTGLNFANKSSLGQGLGLFGIAQGVTNTLTSLSNAIFSGVENDRALKQKRQEMLNTSPTMTGSDNYLLFKQINGWNCFDYVVTKPNDEVLNNIYNLFYYTGYADNLYYEVMPQIKTRKFFNYVKADIGLCTITDPKKRQRIVDAYADGITFEWKYNEHWLMENYIYENWETSIS